MLPVTDGFPAVTIIIPTAGLARYTVFEMSVEGLEVPAGTGIQRGISASLCSSVNEAIRTTRTPFVWFIDDDQQFEPSLLLRLLAHDVDVVVPIVSYSRPPFHPVLFKRTIDVGEWAHHGDLDARIARLRELLLLGYEVQAAQEIRNLVERGPAARPKQLFELFSWDDLDGHAGLYRLPVGGRCGRSGMLVKRRVFDAITPPWFTLGQTNPEEPGEDMIFCAKVQEAGFTIHVDLEQPIGHISPCASAPVRGADGRWGIRLQWENGASVFLPRWPFAPKAAGAVESAALSTPAPAHQCTDGFICEQHPHLPFPHSFEDGRDCSGPATACTAPACPFWGEEPAAQAQGQA